jgi:hypothetical protein
MILLASCGQSELSSSEAQRRDDVIQNSISGAGNVEPGMSQAQVASILGASEGTVTRAEGSVCEAHGYQFGEEQRYVHVIYSGGFVVDVQVGKLGGCTAG